MTCKMRLELVYEDGRNAWAAAVISENHIDLPVADLLKLYLEPMFLAAKAEAGDEGRRAPASV